MFRNGDRIDAFSVLHTLHRSDERIFMRNLLPGLFLLLAGCSLAHPPMTTAASMNPIAESYVRLVLSVGEHDADYVDAYYGASEWRDEAKRQRVELPALHDKAEALLRDLHALARPVGEEMLTLRYDYLERQLSAVHSRIEMLQGKRFTFDEESPHFSEQHFKDILEKLETIVPGSGPLAARVDTYRSRFVIPASRLDVVFKAAIDGCRSRTLQHLTLPASETFTVEYVTGKSWSGYNWYQGGFRSLIQVNTDLPIYIDRAIDLACHEGYPGHHVYNALLEKNLVRDRGWVEYSVYPLFSPQSLIAEGSANFGIDVAFPHDERVSFEKATLFPLAGLDPEGAETYYRILDLVGELSYAGNEAARQYLNGAIDAKAAAGWLVKYSLMSPERAAQRVRFIDQYRSYVINYNYGKDLVREYVEKRGGTVKNPQKRWEEFSRLLSSPRLPSGLR